MPRKSIVFLGETYESQRDFETFVKNLIYNDIGLCNDIQNVHPSHYITLVEILKRHPNFVSKTRNMRNIKIIVDKLNVNAFKVIIVENNGDEIDISWKSAITGKTKGNKHKLMSAMRSSIEEQILRFRQNSEKRCALCFSADKLHVDHHVHFDEIALDYMKSKHAETPVAFGDTNDGTHRKCFLEVDNGFKNGWIEYHRRYATLRMLCQTCNLTRTKSKAR